MTCKDCIHYKACRDALDYAGDYESVAALDGEGCCRNYQDRSRFVEIPCKLGDTVWYELYGKIESAVIYCADATLEQDGIRMNYVEAKGTDGVEVHFRQSNIGKTVFLTRAEAEAKLKEVNQNV